MRPSEGGMHTSTLWRQLFKSPSLTEYLEKSDSQAEPLSFSAYIRELCQQRGEIPERVIKRSNIERSYGHSLFRGGPQALPGHGAATRLRVWRGY